MSVPINLPLGSESQGVILTESVYDVNVVLSLRVRPIGMNGVGRVHNKGLFGECVFRDLESQTKDPLV